MTANLKEISNKLYQECLRHPERTWSQDDLLSLDIIPQNDINLFARCINALFNQKRVTHHQDANSNDFWKVVKPEDVARYKGLTQDEIVVLSHIDGSGTKGIWVRHIRLRTNLSQTTVNNILKKLEQKEAIKQVTSAKNPARKHYMHALLTPSEDVTGGPFYADGTLDEDFVFNISEVVHVFVARHSWINHPSGRKSQNFINASGTSEHHKNKILPITPGYTGFPTLSDITNFVNERKFSDVRLVESDLKQLVDLLCWDGLIVETAGGKAYRATRQPPDSATEISSNGFTEMPCGRCPVFEWCDDDGPVNANTCNYLTDWLNE